MKSPKLTRLALGLSLLLLLSHRTASAFYDPGVQRWLNRDPIGEGGDINLYCLAVNCPLTEIDLWGLALWKCTRGSDFGLGSQHVYLWNDQNNTACGRGGGPFKGRGLNKKRDRGPKEDTCVEIPNSAGKEQSVMACCSTPRTHLFVPGIHDCHNWFDKCLSADGLPDPDIYGRLYGPSDYLREYWYNQFIGGPWPGPR